MIPDRASTLATSFLPQSLTVAGQTLRPMTGGSMMVLQQFRNPLFTAAAAPADPAADPADEEARAKEDYLGLLQFIWVHTAPMEEVIAAAEAGEDGIHTARRAAWKLALEIPVEEVTAFGQSFAGLKSRVESAMTEAVPDGPPGKPAQSPTGLPAWSGPLEVPEIPIASAGSSGSSPSTAPCNTSTPASATMAPASAGPSPVPADPDSPNVIPLPSSPPPAANG